MRVNFAVRRDVTFYATLEKILNPGEKPNSENGKRKIKIGTIKPTTKCPTKSAIVKDLSVRNGYECEFSCDDSDVMAMIPQELLKTYFCVNQLRYKDNKAKIVSPAEGDIIETDKEITIKWNNPGYKVSDSFEIYLCKQLEDSTTLKMSLLGTADGKKNSIRTVFTNEIMQTFARCNLYGTKTDYFYFIMIIVRKGKNSNSKLPNMIIGPSVFSIIDYNEPSIDWPPEP
ncbi:MAG TPA: hypothetical protein PKL98_01855 [Candidatus Pacearchaeota archaeon]|nr:hypothetical protein [Candidatus Pacearchaeota archaeon]